MKTFLKIAAIAAITAFAVISCSPPEVPEAHNDWYDEYNDMFDAARYTGKNATNVPSVSGDLTAYASNFTGVKKDNTVTINFPDKADVLKKNTLATSDLNFISFYTFDATKAAADAAAATTANPNIAATSLIELKNWSFDRRSGNKVFVKLPDLYDTSSHVVFFLDSSKYTHSNGLKIDMDDNGVTGEKGYDDIYQPLTVSGITASAVNPILPKILNWTFVLEDVPPLITGTTETSPASDVTLVNSTFYSQISSTDYDNILKAIVGGFKVESFSGGNWSKFASGSIDDTSTPSRIIAKGLSASHNTAYRIVFEKGSISLQTTKEFFGLKQRITVKNTSQEIISENVLKKRTRIEGARGIYINTTKRDFGHFTGGYTWNEPKWKLENDLDKPTKGYWKPGYSRMSDDDFKTEFNTNPLYDATFDETDEEHFDPETLKDESGNALTGDELAAAKKKGQKFFVSGDPSYTPRASNPGSQIIITVSPPSYIPNQDPPKPANQTKGWTWSISGGFQATEWEQKRVDLPDIIHNESSNTIVSKYSYDNFDGNIVLKILLNKPVTNTVGSITTKYYFKQIDLSTFKNNFKIYSGTGDSNLKAAPDLVEIGIEKVEFKSEGLDGDTDTVKIAGNNVILITLDPNYKKDGKAKYFFIGDGIGYADGITVFSSSNIWDNKGFRGYLVTLTPSSDTF